ncbi:odorant receptor 22c-like, partial [Formica exsecta]|uniref:odorant receptor 22c-like n=1 Tax=Formica exsecta TaxID=72781 RepID=UPI001142FC25
MWRGIWQPIEWSSTGVKLLYNVFTFIVLVLEYSLTLTQFMDIVFVVNNIDDFVADSLMFVTMVAVCCKATIVIIRRSAIIDLIQALLKEPCKPREKDEVMIQTKFDKFISLQTCAQFEIFESRLRKLIANKTIKCLEYSSVPPDNGRLIISEYIHHHLSIYKYAKTVNIIFNQVLFVQFFSSILVLCTTVYYMSAHIMEFKGATFMVYTFCMFIQIYIYCWSGNEVILKSQNVGDAIYHMDWPLLSVGEKKDLLIIMIRGTIPIKFTSSFLITLSLQSYSNVSVSIIFIFEI